MSMFIKRLVNKDNWQCPTNWSIVLLEKNAKRGSGHTPNKKIPEYWNQGIKWVSLSDSYRLDNLYIHDTDKKISELGIANSSAVLHPPGIVILSRDAGVGKSAITSMEMAVSQHFIVWECNDKTLNNHFLYYWLQFMKPEFERIAIGSTIKTIGLPYFKKMLILRPPIEEQRKIASILGAWDEEIRLTERLIEAKQKYKKGLMQQLLTGKMRFPGFEGEWKKVRIKEIATINGKTVSGKSNPNKAYYYIDLASVNKGKIDFPTRKERFAALPSRARRILSQSDVIMSTVRPNLLGFAVCNFPTGDVLCSTGFALITPHNTRDSDFIYHSLYGSYIQRQIHGLVTGSNYPAINSTEVKQMRILWPESNKERHLIGEVLSACDDEISLLQRKVAALREQKKGLMQQLLTGKVRV